uniref:Uncharacterized protein n=1 Tax=Romanomermis culicivorax TaxID=13658 RepID=A0A915JQL7_ROMCU
MAVDVLIAPMVLLELGPEVAPQALEFISNGTIQALPVDKFLLDGEPSWPAVNAIPCAVEQGSQIPQPAPAIAALLPMTMRTSVQTLLAIAQQLPPAAASTSSPTLETTAFGETLHPVDNDISIIEVSPFPWATAWWSLKIGILGKSTYRGA